MMIFHSYVKLPEGTDSNHGEKSYLNITKQQLLNYLRQPEVMRKKPQRWISTSAGTNCPLTPVAQTS